MLPIERTSCAASIVTGLLLCSACGQSDARDTEGQRASFEGHALAVSPTADLLDGQGLTVRLSGFPPDTPLVVGQCANPVLTVRDACGGPFLTPTSDATGSFEGVLTVQRSYPSISGKFVSCVEPGSCAVAAGISATSTDPATLEVVPLSFRDVGPVEPPPPPPPPPGVSFTVTPSSGLADLQSVTLQFAGDYAGGGAEIATCKAGADLGPPGVFGSLSLTDCSPSTHVPFVDGQSLEYQVSQIVQPPVGDAFTCSAAAPCVIVAKPSALLSPAVVPISFVAMEPPRRGTAQVTPASNHPGQLIQVNGSGWAASASVFVGFCPANRDEPSCLQSGVGIDSSGAFFTSTLSQPYFYLGSELIDCTAAPGACVVRIADRRDPAGTRLDIPYTVFSHDVPRGTAKLDTSTPLVPFLRVRIGGTGWAPNATISALICEGKSFSNCGFDASMTGLANSDGVLRSYLTLAAALDADCVNQPEACSLAVFDQRAPTGTVTWIPLSFTHEGRVQVVSRYEPAYETLFQNGMTATGQDAASLQLLGSARLLYVLAYTGAQSGTHLPMTGTFTHATEYSVSEYMHWSDLAARFDYTLEELQKTGALFWAWLATGRPPLPT